MENENEKNLTDFGLIMIEYTGDSICWFSRRMLFDRQLIAIKGLLVQVVCVCVCVLSCVLCVDWNEWYHEMK